MADSEPVDEEDYQVDLPPQMEDLIAEIESDGKKLRKDDAYKNVDQLRKYVSMNTYGHMVEIVELLGAAAVDTYGLSSQVANQLARLRAFAIKHLKALGAKIEMGEMADLPGVGIESLEETKQAFYALGNLLREKLPNDKAVEEAWNQVAAGLLKMSDELTGIVTPEAVEEASGEDGNGEAPAEPKE
jgi:hypothetical protein